MGCKGSKVQILPSRPNKPSRHKKAAFRAAFLCLFPAAVHQLEDFLRRVVLPVPVTGRLNASRLSSVGNDILPTRNCCTRLATKPSSTHSVDGSFHRS